MLVYTYFQPLPAIEFLEETKLHSYWRKSWSDSEFTPITLTHQIAESHPKFAQYDALVRSFPSINPAGYDLACWHRWLALAQVGGGLMTDYDVICRGFSEEFLQFPNPVTILDRGGVPCAVHATAEGAQQIVDDVLSFRHKHDGQHYSDMYFFQAKGYPRAGDLTAPYGSAEWPVAPAVHFSHSDCGREQPGVFRTKIVWDLMIKPFLPPAVEPLAA